MIDYFVSFETSLGNGCTVVKLQNQIASKADVRALQKLVQSQLNQELEDSTFAIDEVQEVVILNIIRLPI